MQLLTQQLGIVCRVRILFTVLSLCLECRRGTKGGRNIDDLLDNKTNDNKTNAMYEFQTDECVFEVHTGVKKRKLVQNDPAKKLVTPTGTGTISDSSSGHSETPKKNLFSSKKRRKLL